MDAADIAPYELVHINSMSNAAHWETFAIPGAPGQICLNGCPARLFMPGDQVIILSLGLLGDSDLRNVKHKAIYVNEQNEIVSVDVH
jgi:aspartate 1-decarboxylase